MSKLSDTQSIILSAAAQRPDGNVLPLPGSLRGGAAGKVVGALLSRGLIREQVTESLAKADPALNLVWRNLEDGRGVLLYITPEGLAAIGVEPEGEADDAGTASSGEHAAQDPQGAAEPALAAADRAPADPAREVGTTDEAPVEPSAKKRGRRKQASSTAPEGAPAHKRREGSKQALMIAMLQRPEGATIAQIVDATGWQPHTVRGAFAGALKKKLGLTVTSEKVEGKGRIYRLQS